MSILSDIAKPRQLVILGLCVLGVVYVIWLISTHTGSGVSDTAYYRMYVDIETGKPFRHKVQVGDSWPIASPYSGKNTGMPAEACYWTPDGTIKKDPDWVVLNDLVGKSGPTFCPVCGRLVVGHNPAPAPGKKPPPTQDEYLAAHGTSDAANQHGASR